MTTIHHLHSLGNFNEELMWWKIIENAPESVLALRLTSKTFRTRVERLALYWTNFPLVKIISLSQLETKEASPTATFISLEVDKRKSDLFELRLKIEPGNEFISRIARVKPWSPDDDANWNYRVRFDRTANNEDVLKYLRKCMGTRVNTSILHYCDDPRSEFIFSKLLEGSQVHHFVHRSKVLTDDNVDNIIQTINLNTVSKLSLVVHRIGRNDPTNILLELSTLVRCMSISQYFVSGIDTEKRYFFGMQDRDWSAVILNMFSGKMDMLEIDNQYYRKFLTRSEADTLRKRLPMIGKKVWYETTCAAFSNDISYTKKEHTVIARGSPWNSLSIKHLSKIDETF